MEIIMPTLKKIAVLTNDKYLFQKLRLELRKNSSEAVTDTEEAELVICDIDTVKPVANAISVSRHENRGADFTLPLSLAAIRKLTENGRNALTLDEKTRTAELMGQKIKLTELEARLLSLLMKSGGFVSREEIISKLWGESAEGGILNVYVHYLREKLEKNGEKIIISSRKSGYRISEKYSSGGEQ
jgi:DNA-binding response OmpR family regulator